MAAWPGRCCSGDHAPLARGDWAGAALISESVGLRSGAPASVMGAQARCAVDEARPLQPCRRRAASDREQIDRAGRCLPDHWTRARWPPLKRLAHRCAVRRRPLPTLPLNEGVGGNCGTPDPSAPGHPSSLPVIPTLLWRLPPDPTPQGVRFNVNTPIMVLTSTVHALMLGVNTY